MPDHLSYNSATFLRGVLLEVCMPEGCHRFGSYGRRIMAGGQQIVWPAKLRHTTTRDSWYKRFAKLRPGLSLQQVSRQLKQSYASVYRWADVFEYPFPDLRERGRVPADEWENVDWSQRDADIARDLGVSRERIRQVRAARGVGPSSHRLTVKHFEKWAKARRPKLNGVPVTDALRAFGQDISPQVARRILRLVGVTPHDPGSRWARKSIGGFPTAI